MKAIATKVIGLLACAFVALQSFGFFSTYCAWGCTQDLIVSSAEAIFFLALIGVLYFLIRICLILFQALCGNKHSAGTKNDVS